MIDQIKKLNRGLAIFFVIIVIASIYIVTTIFDQKNDKPEIEATCQDFLDTTAKYSLLPTDYQTGEEVIPDEVYSDYLSEVDDAILAYYIDDDSYQSYAKTQYESILDQQKAGDSYILLDLSYDIKNFDSISFYNNLVTVTFTAQVAGNYLQNEYGVWNEANFSEIGTSTITLAPEGGKWKIEYANIYFPSVGSNADEASSQNVYYSY